MLVRYDTWRFYVMLCTVVFLEIFYVVDVLELNTRVFVFFFFFKLCMYRYSSAVNEDFVETHICSV